MCLGLGNAQQPLPLLVRYLTKGLPYEIRRAVLLGPEQVLGPCEWRIQVPRPSQDGMARYQAPQKVDPRRHQTQIEYERQGHPSS
jgi:hypothetical protein